MMNTMSSRCKYYIILIFLAVTKSVDAQTPDNFEISGYNEALPIFISADLPLPAEKENFFEFRFQNRLNTKWFASETISFTGEMRTRLFTGDFVQNIPFYAETIDTDDGFFDFSWMIAEEDNWLLHVIPDRLYGEWRTDKWSIRTGRQRVNWGINLVSNPNDLFNIYSFYDFSYPERPGTDAIRIQHFLGFASRMELTVSPGRDAEETVAAFLYAFNTSGYDIQVIGGYFKERITLGGGWAGNIRQTGFKGELMFFHDLTHSESIRKANIVISASADHMLQNGLFLVAELLYNQNGGRDNFSVFGQNLSADNPSFSRFQFTSYASYSFTPLISSTLSAIYYPDEDAAFISPQFTYSLVTDLDFSLISQFFMGSGDSAFANAGTVLSGSLKWNF